MRDAQAFRQIVARYGGLIYGTCRRILADSTEAEDVTQDCFVYLASRPPRIHTSLGAWLHRLATHRSYDRLKSDGRRRVREERFAGESPATAEASMNDVLDHVDEAVNLLPDKYRHVLVSHYYLDKSHADIARELGLSRRAVGYRIDKGLSRLREHLERAGITTPAAALTGFMSSNLCEAAPATLVTKIGSMAVAGAATTQSTAAATILAGLSFPKAAISLGLALLLAAVAWWGGTVLLPDSEEHAVEQTAVPIGSAPSASQDPPGEAVSQGASPELTLPPAPQPAATVIEGLGRVSGQVVMADTRQPVPGVEVITSPHLYTAMTDQSGHFHIDRCTPGLHRITVRTVKMGIYVPTGAPITFSIVPTRETSGIVIPVTNEGIVQGRLTMDGRPLARQYVSVFYEDRTVASEFGIHHDPSDKMIWSTNVPGGQQWKRTDVNGRFRFGGLIDGEVRLRADLDFGKEPYMTNSRLFQMAMVESGATTNVHLEFVPAQGVIEGQLHLDKKAIRHAGVGAKLASSGDDDGEIYFANVGEDGYYVLDGLPAGTLSVWAYIRESDETEGQQRCTWVTPVPGQILLQDFDFFREPRISGYVSNLDSGEEATVVAVKGELELDGFIPETVEDLRGLNPSFEVKVQADGTFYIEGPELVEYTLLVLAVMGQELIEADDAARTRWGSGRAWPNRLGDSRSSIGLE